MRNSGTIGSCPQDTFVPSPGHVRHGGVLLKLAISLVTLVGLATGGFVWFSSAGSAKAAGEDLAIQAVSEKTFDVVLTANGDLQAAQETVLRNPLEKQGTIVEIIAEGVMVKKGDVLVRLSTDALKTDFDQQTLELESAKNELVCAENNLAIQESTNSSTSRSAKIKLDLATLALKKWQEGDDQEQMKELALDIEAAKREVDRLQEKYDRAVQLHEASFLSSDELKIDQLNLIREQSELEKATLRSNVYQTYEREMQRTRLDGDIQEAQSEMDRVERSNSSELASKQADRINRQKQMELRQERVNKITSQMNAATITAPSDGLVVYATSIRQNMWGGGDGPLKVGSNVAPNDEIIVLPDNSRMVAAIKVHESLVGKVKPGQSARVKIDAVRDRTFTGTVESVGVVAEQGGWRDPNLREYMVRIGLDLGGENPGLKPSMRCEGQIVLTTVKSALAAPIQAVFFEGKTSYVHVPAPGGKYAKRAVNVGTRSDSYAEITAGLRAGDKVLVRRPKAEELLTDTIDVSGVPAAPDVAQKPQRKHGPRDEHAPTEASADGAAGQAATAASSDASG